MIDYQVENGHHVPLIYFGNGSVCIFAITGNCGTPGISLGFTCGKHQPGEVVNNGLSYGDHLPVDAQAAVLLFTDIRGVVALEDFLLDVKQRLLGMPLTLK